MSPGCPNFLNPLVMFGYTQAGIEALTPMGVQIDRYVRDYSYSGTLFQPLMPPVPELKARDLCLPIPAKDPFEGVYVELPPQLVMEREKPKDPFAGKKIETNICIDCGNVWHDCRCRPRF